MVFLTYQLHVTVPPNVVVFFYDLPVGFLKLFYVFIFIELPKFYFIFIKSTIHVVSIL